MQRFRWLKESSLDEPAIGTVKLTNERDLQAPLASSDMRVRIEPVWQ
jgi:hypothetical protein